MAYCSCSSGMRCKPWDQRCPSDPMMTERTCWCYLLGRISFRWTTVWRRTVRIVRTVHIPLAATSVRIRHTVRITLRLRQSSRIRVPLPRLRIDRNLHLHPHQRGAHHLSHPLCRHQKKKLWRWKKRRMVLNRRICWSKNLVACMPCINAQSSPKHRVPVVCFCRH